jgi:hypothetical protein
VCGNGLAQCRKGVTGTKGPVVIAKPGGLAIQKAVPDLARKQVIGGSEGVNGIAAVGR